ncbi:gas vesicle protein GvpG [archaeon]|nr:MAG: gas vesicle protein GvpG [archaeon]
MPILGPIRGVIWIAEKMNEQVERKLYDEEAVHGQLMELELHYEMGEISEEEYLEAEEALLEKLKLIEKHKAKEV